MPFRKDDVEATIEELQHIGLFAKMSNADLRELAQLGQPVDAEPNSVLMDQGDVGTECFLVLEGEAGVISGDQHVATLGRGSVVGEMALIGHRPRNASVVAQTPMRLLAFDIAGFKRLLDDMPMARAHIFELLEARATANGG